MHVSESRRISQWIKLVRCGMINSIHNNERCEEHNSYNVKPHIYTITEKLMRRSSKCLKLFNEVHKSNFSIHE